MNWIKVSLKNNEKKKKHIIEVEIEFSEECTQQEASDFVWEALCDANMRKKD